MGRVLGGLGEGLGRVLGGFGEGFGKDLEALGASSAILGAVFFVLVSRVVFKSALGGFLMRFDSILARF